MREVGRHRGRETQFGVEPGLAAQVAARARGPHAVVLGHHGAPQRIGVQLEIVGAVQLADARDRSGLVQAVEPLRPPERAPQVFLVLAANEAPDIEPERGVRARVKPQSEERDAELGRPAGGVARDGDVPHAVPVLVQGVDTRELRVPHRPLRVRGEHEGVAPVVEAVDQEPDVVVAREVGVAAQLGGPHPPHIRVVAAHRDVERVGVVRHPDDRPLGRGGTLDGLALAQVVDRVRGRPERLGECAVERHRPRDRHGAERIGARRCHSPPRGPLLRGTRPHPRPCRRAGEQGKAGEREGEARRGYLTVKVTVSATSGFKGMCLQSATTAMTRWGPGLRESSRNSVCPRPRW